MIKKSDFTYFMNYMMTLCSAIFFLVLDIFCAILLFSPASQIPPNQAWIIIGFLLFVVASFFGMFLKYHIELSKAQKTAIDVVDINRMDLDVRFNRVDVYARIDGKHFFLVKHQLAPAALSEWIKKDKLHKVLVTESGKCYLLKNRVTATKTVTVEPLEEERTQAKD